MTRTVLIGSLESMQHYDIIRNPDDVIHNFEEAIKKCGYCGIEDETELNCPCKACSESLDALDN